MNKSKKRFFLPSYAGGQSNARGYFLRALGGADEGVSFPSSCPSFMSASFFRVQLPVGLGSSMNAPKKQYISEMPLLEAR